MPHIGSPPPVRLPGFIEQLLEKILPALHVPIQSKGGTKLFSITSAHALAQLFIVDQLFQRQDQLIESARLDDKTTQAVIDDFQQACMARGDDRLAGAHGFQINQAEGFIAVKRGETKISIT